jgi:hypothetical protein
MAYDIIGDIDGQADKLEALLRTLGYRDTVGAWRHQERQAIFVGDFLDRGPAQVRSIDIVRRMVDAGAALAVMGNHELNAIAWHTPDSRRSGDFLRSHFSSEWETRTGNSTLPSWLKWRTAVYNQALLEYEFAVEGDVLLWPGSDAAARVESLVNAVTHAADCTEARLLEVDPTLADVEDDLSEEPGYAR